ncbi:DUF2225 domain-containing protein [Heliorestis convoluta]|uniref:DUF2225 domain-containing protein n=1 Tax=Heliorestis convoluta TaxID=356322 RepID=A0A5Q2N4M1_9FIRM|nr:DUF2225 domain-containing protein [Heliorestis convoluta]QGG48262.1 hypothetical protein FTV88_2164 [Heliorestis convoluta]
MSLDNAFFTKEKTCPICSQIFFVTRVRSSYIRVKERKADFMLLYEGVNPLHYQIFVCPSCSYAAQDNSFDSPGGDPRKLTRALVTLRKKEPSFQGLRSLPVVLRSYELAIQTAQLCLEPASVIASLCLKSAWIAREMDDEAMVYFYIKEAIPLYEKAYESEHCVGKMTSTALSYLIGELHRQVGNYDVAIRWFSRSISENSKQIKKEPEIERLARQQWSLAKEEFKAEAQSDNPKASAIPQVAITSPDKKKKDPPIVPPVKKAKKN